MNRGFQYKMATGRAALPVAVIVSLAFWLIQTDDHYQIAGMTVCGLSTYLLYGLNSAFGIIKARSYLAPAFFVLMYTAFSFMQYHHGFTGFIPLLFTGSLFSIIKAYESHNPQVDVFNSFLCGGLACMTDNRLIPAIPVLFICMILLRSMSVKGILAALTGFTAPYLALSGYYIYTDRIKEAVVIMQESFNVQLLDYNGINILHWVYISAIFLLFILTSILAEKISLKDKVKNRLIIKSLNITGIYIFAIIAIIPSTGYLLFPVTMIVLSIIYGYVMTQLYNRATLIIMIFSLLTISGIFLYNLFFI